LKSRQVVPNGIPYDLMVDRGIAMDQHVSERDGLWQIRNLGRKRRIEPPQAGEGFADDSNRRSTADRSMSSSR